MCGTTSTEPRFKYDLRNKLQSVLHINRTSINSIIYTNENQHDHIRTFTFIGFGIYDIQVKHIHDKKKIRYKTATTTTTKPFSEYAIQTGDPIVWNSLLLRSMQESKSGKHF